MDEYLNKILLEASRINKIFESLLTQLNILGYESYNRYGVSGYEKSNILICRDDIFNDISNGFRINIFLIDSYYPIKIFLINQFDYEGDNNDFNELLSFLSDKNIIKSIKENESFFDGLKQKIVISNEIINGKLDISKFKVYTEIKIQETVTYVAAGKDDRIEEITTYFYHIKYGDFFIIEDDYLKTLVPEVKENIKTSSGYVGSFYDSTNFSEIFFSQKDTENLISNYNQDDHIKFLQIYNQEDVSIEEWWNFLPLYVKKFLIAQNNFNEINYDDILKIKSLRFYDDDLTLIKYLYKLENIEDIYLLASKGKLNDLEIAKFIFNHRKSLTSLYIMRMEKFPFGNNLDLTFINDLSELQSLELKESLIPNLTLPKLKYLKIAGCFLKDLSNIKELKELTYLDISHNPINDYTTLLDFQNLKTLIITHPSIYFLCRSKSIEYYLKTKFKFNKTIKEKNEENELVQKLYKNYTHIITSLRDKGVEVIPSKQYISRDTVFKSLLHIK